MAFVSKWIQQLGPAGLVLQALVWTGLTIAVLLAFILVRRGWRRGIFAHRDRRTFYLRQHWNEILEGAIPVEIWRFDPVDRAVVETIVLDRLEVADPRERSDLLTFLRSTGLLDLRIQETRVTRGWTRRQALVSLGRMHAAEAIPALSEALDDPHVETRIAAVRGLGRTGLASAAHPIVEHLLSGTLRIPGRVTQNALLACCRATPAVLLPYIRKASDSARPLLARVLGEIATPELEDDLLLLASDPLPDVRAAAARALAEAQPRLALTALAGLAEDPEWFVRLRAVVALGTLRDPSMIPVLMETLCDPNRYVRRRSAAALARMENSHAEILMLATRTGDRYALQTIVSELQRSGGILKLASELNDPIRSADAREALLTTMKAGAHRMLLDAMFQHPDWRVRGAVARLLVQSRELAVIPLLERIAARYSHRREQRMARFVIRELQRYAELSELSAQVPA
ncbi:MAG: HEAT repeat domain-containing protein [Acidobacteria bacterium]|nr:HEAT repeat domain-containing protein [Acidobacteriota bacterium]